MLLAGAFSLKSMLVTLLCGYGKTIGGGLHARFLQFVVEVFDAFSTVSTVIVKVQPFWSTDL